MISHSLSYHIMGDVEVQLPLKKGIQNWKFQWRVRVLHLALKVVHQLRDDHIVRVCHLVQREDLLNTLDGAHCNVNSLQPRNVFWDWLSIVPTARALVRLLPSSHYFKEFFGKKNLETVCNWSHNDSLSLSLSINIKVIGTMIPLKARCGPENAQRYSSMTAELEGGEWSAARPGHTVPPRKTRYPFYRRVGGPQGRYGRAENLVPTGIWSRNVQPMVSRSLNK